jgi:hypothetical protein
MSFIRLLTSTAAFAVAATIANAADMPVKAPVAPAAVQQATGYVEVYGGWASTRFRDTFCEVGVGCETFSETFRGWALGGAGRGNYWISPNMSVQLDAQAEGTSYKENFGGGFNENFSNHSYLIGGHISWRDSQRGLLGVFAGAGDAGGGFLEAKRHVVGGVEGQLYWNQFTLYLQGGYDTIVGDSFFGEPHAWFARGTGRYFVTPNTVIEGTVLYATGEIEFNPLFFPPGASTSRDFQTWLWEAKLEHRFATTPFSAFVKYRGSETKYDTMTTFAVPPDTFTAENKVTDHRVLVGLRLYLGQNTLIANDRNGATLDIIDPLSIQSGPLMTPPVLGIN